MSIARTKAEAAWRELIEVWEARLAGDTEDAERRYEAAREICRVRGFRYLPMARVVELPTDQLVSRLLASADAKGKPNTIDAAALLGAVEKPKITVSKALDLYWGIADDLTIGKSDTQIRIWKNPRKKAVKNFIEVVGDLALDEISPDDMQDFRDWWVKRVRADEVNAGSANKEIGHIGTILNAVNKAKRLGLSLPMSGWMIKGAEKRTRPSFSRAWIEDRILAPRALDGLNPDARGVLLGMINTGYRPSEGASLRSDQIRLDCDVPHISIEPVGRQLKSAHARREIPLLGVNLDAFKAFPGGFTRYEAARSYRRRSTNTWAPTHCWKARITRSTPCGTAFRTG